MLGEHLPSLGAFGPKVWCCCLGGYGVQIRVSLDSWVLTYKNEDCSRSFPKGGAVRRNTCVHQLGLDVNTRGT